MKRIMNRSTMSWVLGAVVLVGALTGTRLAFSGKATDTGNAAPINTGPSPMPQPGGCDNSPQFEQAQKLVNAVIEKKKWTAKDHEQIAPLFYSLHTDQKIEILKKVGAALDSRKMVVEKGSRLF
jgi:hypothetical protein